MKKYFIIIFITILTVVLCICFIDKNDSSLVNSKVENSIMYGVEEIPNDLSTVSNLNSSDMDIICFTSKGLVCKNEENKVIPSLASEYVVSNDGIQYEFKIRDDICWSDGSKITCDDIKEYFRQLIKEEKEENITSLLNIYGARNYKEGKGTFDKSVAIKVRDNSIIIRLNKKDSSFLEELTKPQYRIRKYLVLWKDIRKNYKSLVFSGDYKIESMDENIAVLKNNNDNEKGIQSINIIRDSSTEQSMAAYEVGERDIVINPPESELNKLSEAKKLITVPENLGVYLVINNHSGNIPLNGRREIYSNVYNAIVKYQSSNSNEFNVAEGCYFRENQNNLNLIQARKVNSNKKGEWSAPSILTIIAEDNKINRTVCRAIKDWFAENTKITVKYNLATDEEFNDYELTQKYDMILVDNKADYKDKEAFYTNFEKYLNETDRNLLEKNRINDYYGEYYSLEESLFSNYNILPLCFKNKNIALSDKVSSINFDGNGNLNFSDIK